MKTNKKYEILEIKKSNEYVDLEKKKINRITTCAGIEALGLIFSPLGWLLPAYASYWCIKKEHAYLLGAYIALLGVIATISITRYWNMTGEIKECIEEVKSISNKQKQLLLEGLDKRSNFIE